VFGINNAVAQAQALISRAEGTRAKADALIDDIQDGVKADIVFDEGAMTKLMDMFTNKRGGKLSVTIDPTWDKASGTKALFKGGPYDKQKFRVEEGTEEITLKGGHRYKWTGHHFEFQPPKKKRKKAAP